MQEHESSNLEEIVPPVRVDKPGLELLDGDQLDKLSFELFKEAASLLIAFSNIYIGEPKLERNQAIGAGLLIRTAKFMAAIMCLAVDRINHRGVILSLSRSALEATINLRYLLRVDDPATYDEFVKAGLAPEKELVDVINADIEKRGSKLPTEDRMLRSVDRILMKSGIPIEKLDSKFRNWGGNLRERLRFIDEGELYLFVQRLPSHAVHGSWVDLLFHHLEYEDGYFVPNSDDRPIDARLFNPTSTYVLRGAQAYIEKYYGQLPEAQPFIQRITDLSEYLLAVDQAHENWLSTWSREEAKSK